MLVRFKMSLDFWWLFSPVAIIFLALLLETIIEKKNQKKAPASKSSRHSKGVHTGMVDTRCISSQYPTFLQSVNHIPERLYSLFAPSSFGSTAYVRTDYISCCYMKAILRIYTYNLSPPMAIFT